MLGALPQPVCALVPESWLPSGSPPPGIPNKARGAELIRIYAKCKDVSHMEIRTKVCAQTHVGRCMYNPPLLTK